MKSNVCKKAFCLKLSRAFFQAAEQIKRGGVESDGGGGNGQQSGLQEAEGSQELAPRVGTASWIHRKRIS